MPLQKSFSDTNHSSKQRRPQWNRNRSFGGPQTSKTNPPSKLLQDKPPIPVSSTTKNKLGIYQFTGQTIVDSKAQKNVISLLSDDEKENASVTVKGRGHLGHRKDMIDVDGQPVLRPELIGVDGQSVIDERAGALKSLDTTCSQKIKSNLPSTPAARLALPDLIGMEDVRRSVQDISPEDRIEWDRHSSNSSFGIRKTKRRRTRSSSPVSSPSHKNPQHHELQVDPGSELWGRYSLTRSNVPHPERSTIPALAQLMQTSSPQPSNPGTTPRSVAGFRRTNSCGTQFPKRRRVGGTDDNDVFTGSVSLGPSHLSVFIEKVQEGLVRPKQTESSSPSISILSGVSRLSGFIGEGERSGGAARLTESPSSRAWDQVPLQSRPRGSDYGEFDDDDLDDPTLLDSLTVQLGPPIANTSHLPYLPHPQMPSNRPGQNVSAESPHSPAIVVSKPSEPQLEQTKEDEFDEFDEELFAADLEGIVAQFDNGLTAEQTIPLSGAEDSKPQEVTFDKPESEDEFGDGGLDDIDFENAEATATQSLQHTSSSVLPSTQKLHSIQRYLVVKIVDSRYKTSTDVEEQQEKILFLKMDRTKVMRTVYLRGLWVDTPVTVDAVVHIIGAFEPAGKCVIDDADNMLILHPDHLISATVVGDSFGCIRRAVLQDRVKATSDANISMLYGTILHEIFQSAMLANQWDSGWLSNEIEKCVARHMEDLYAISVDAPRAVGDLQSKMPELQAWAKLFVSSQPLPGALIDAGRGTKANVCVSKLLDVEEHVWSPMYGLKGNIDATVQVTMQDEKQSRALTVPFELKTGKNLSPAHRVQTALYNLLLSDRYDVEIAYGILYYMETSATIGIPAVRLELIHMIMKRNELACFVREKHAHLPPMLKSENSCGRCYAKVPCFIYHRLADDGNGETSGLKDRFDTVVKHLTPNHRDFFLKWDELLTKEEKESLKFRPELWTMLSSEREKLGRCFSNVIIEPGSAYEEKNNSKINHYRYTLIKHSPRDNFSFLDSQIIVGEPIVMSDEKGHFALANGFVTHVQKRTITIAVDRRLHNARIRGPGFNEVNNQVFASIMEVTPGGTPVEQPSGNIIEEPVQYRLDKDEFSNGMATARNNLIQVMADGPFGSREIRSLVVDLNAPRFKTQSTAYTLAECDKINVDQQRAIQKVMSAQNYALVLGMPGTGKTTTIAHIIRALVSQGKTVLLTSYTHSAVDNILLKLKDDIIPILRLGNIAKINTEVQGFATLAATTKSSFDEIKSAWHGSPIVATTCLGVNHPIFRERTFDYCIVDEASQITLPICLGPIRLARTFVLVGDHYQLPPLVQNEEAQKGGLDVSLFKHLSDIHPSSVVYLEHQYRMCKDVMALSNNLIYDGRLKCGSQEVAQQRISLPNIEALKYHHYNSSTLSRNAKTICLAPTRGQCWIRDLLDPETRVSFINTDPLLPASREEAKGNRIINPTEVTICVQLVESLLCVGVPVTSIGVMTHYRSQLEKLRYGLRAHQDLEMHTADRFQGRDKEVIILSLVRSNEAKSIGELLKDQRRINVAFTRAKAKLLVIGSRETLKGNKPKSDGTEEMVARFVGLMEEKNWIYDLPNGALENHCFEEEATQAAASGVSRYAGTQWVQVKHEVDSQQVLKDSDQENSGGKKRRVLGEGKESRNMQRQPAKKIRGNKPFKVPQMSVLTDILNEVLH